MPRSRAPEMRNVTRDKRVLSWEQRENWSPGELGGSFASSFAVPKALRDRYGVNSLERIHMLLGLWMVLEALRFPRLPCLQALETFLRSVVETLGPGVFDKCSGLRVHFLSNPYLPETLRMFQKAAMKDPHHSFSDNQGMEHALARVRAWNRVWCVPATMENKTEMQIVAFFSTLLHDLEHTDWTQLSSGEYDRLSEIISASRSESSADQASHQSDLESYTLARDMEALTGKLVTDRPASAPGGAFHGIDTSMSMISPVPSQSNVSRVSVQCKSQSPPAKKRIEKRTRAGGMLPGQRALARSVPDGLCSLCVLGGESACVHCMDSTKYSRATVERYVPTVGVATLVSPRPEPLHQSRAEAEGERGVHLSDNAAMKELLGWDESDTVTSFSVYDDARAIWESACSIPESELEHGLSWSPEDLAEWREILNIPASSPDEKYGEVYSAAVNEAYNATPEQP